MSALRVTSFHRFALRDACPRANRVPHYSKPSHVFLHPGKYLQCSAPCLAIHARRLATFTPNPSSKSGNEEERALSQQKKSLLSRFLPPSFVPPENASANLGKIVALGGPEKRTLFKAVGLVCLLALSDYCFSDFLSSSTGWQLFISSSVSLSVPLTVGKLIDYFSSKDSVSQPSVMTPETPNL